MSRPRQPQPTVIPDRYSRRFEDLKREFQQLEYFCKGTLLKRMMKCGKAQCACRQDPDKRHGPYFEWTYKAKGKTVNVKLTPELTTMFRAASQQYRRLRSLLNRLERLSQTVLRLQAKRAQSARRD
jgi:phosphopantetheine adenylyltransferase